MVCATFHLVWALAAWHAAAQFSAEEKMLSYSGSYAVWYGQTGSLPTKQQCTRGSEEPDTIDGSSWTPHHFLAVGPSTYIIAGLRSSRPSSSMMESPVLRGDVFLTVDEGETWRCLDDGSRSPGDMGVAARAGATAFVVEPGLDQRALVCIAGGRIVGTANGSTGSPQFVQPHAERDVWCLDVPGSLSEASDGSTPKWTRHPDLPTSLVGGTYVRAGPTPDGGMHHVIVGGRRDANSPPLALLVATRTGTGASTITWRRVSLLATPSVQRVTRLRPVAAWLPISRLLMIGGGSLDLGVNYSATADGGQGSGEEVNEADLETGGLGSDPQLVDMVSVRYSAAVGPGGGEFIPFDLPTVAAAERLELPVTRSRGAARVYTLAASISADNVTVHTPSTPDVIVLTAGGEMYAAFFGKSISDSFFSGYYPHRVYGERSSSGQARPEGSPAPYPSGPPLPTFSPNAAGGGWVPASASPRPAVLRGTAPGSLIGLNIRDHPWASLLVADAETGQLFRGAFTECVAFVGRQCGAGMHARCSASPYDGTCEYCNRCALIDGRADCSPTAVAPECAPCVGCQFGPLSQVVDVCGAPGGPGTPTDRLANATHHACFASRFATDSPVPQPSGGSPPTGTLSPAVSDPALAIQLRNAAQRLSSHASIVTPLLLAFAALCALALCFAVHRDYRARVSAIDRKGGLSSSGAVAWSGNARGLCSMLGALMQTTRVCLSVLSATTLIIYAASALQLAEGFVQGRYRALLFASGIAVPALIFVRPMLAVCITAYLGAWPVIVAVARDKWNRATVVALAAALLLRPSALPSGRSATPLLQLQLEGRTTKCNAPSWASRRRFIQWIVLADAAAVDVPLCIAAASGAITISMGAVAPELGPAAGFVSALSWCGAILQLVHICDGAIQCAFFPAPTARVSSGRQCVPGQDDAGSVVSVNVLAVTRQVSGGPVSLDATSSRCNDGPRVGTQGARQWREADSANACAPPPVSGVGLSHGAGGGGEDIGSMLAQMRRLAATPEGRLLATMRIFFRGNPHLLPEAIQAVQQVPLPPEWRQTVGGLVAQAESHARDEGNVDVGDSDVSCDSVDSGGDIGISSDVTA